jgi:hypothetical protein
MKVLAVLNWSRAGAVIAQIDPVAKGYLLCRSKREAATPGVASIGEHREPERRGTNQRDRGIYATQLV